MSSACSLTMTTGPIEVGRSSRNGDIPGLTSGLALRLGLRLHGPLPQVTRDWPDMQHLALGMTWWVAPAVHAPNFAVLILLQHSLDYVPVNPTCTELCEERYPGRSIGPGGGNRTLKRDSPLHKSPPSSRPATSRDSVKQFNTMAETTEATGEHGQDTQISAQLQGVLDENPLQADVCLHNIPK